MNEARIEAFAEGNFLLKKREPQSRFGLSSRSKTSVLEEASFSAIELVDNANRQL